jgi:hypothetical protein
MPRVGKFFVSVVVYCLDIWADVLVVASVGGVLLGREEKGFGRVARGRGIRG